MAVCVDRDTEMGIDRGHRVKISAPSCLDRAVRIHTMLPKNDTTTESKIKG